MIHLVRVHGYGLDLVRLDFAWRIIWRNWFCLLIPTTSSCGPLQLAVLGRLFSFLVLGCIFPATGAFVGLWQAVLASTFQGQVPFVAALWRYTFK